MNILNIIDNQIEIAEEAINTAERNAEETCEENCHTVSHGYYEQEERVCGWYCEEAQEELETAKELPAKLQAVYDSTEAFQASVSHRTTLPSWF